MSDPDNLIVGGIAARPEPFVANILPRDGKAEIVRQEWENAQKLLDPETKQWKETPEGDWDATLRA